MENQVNSICKSCYYQIRNIGLIRKYINDETCNTLVQALIISRLDYGNALLYNIHLSYSECRTVLHVWWHALENGTYNTSFFPAALASCRFQITVQDSVSYIQYIKWNSTNLSKRSDRKIYTSENFKPVYYVWNVFDLYELRICFNCVLNVKRLRAISVD